jgi:hypothetical protein
VKEPSFQGNSPLNTEPITGAPLASVPAAPRAGLTLASSALGLFMITLDAVVVNVALPSISQDLGGGMTGSQ